MSQIKTQFKTDKKHSDVLPFNAAQGRAFAFYLLPLQITVTPRRYSLGAKQTLTLMIIFKKRRSPNDLLLKID